jgi:hypothetical protein
MPPEWPDHYSINSAKREEPSISSINLEELGL